TMSQASDSRAARYSCQVGYSRISTSGTLCLRKRRPVGGQVTDSRSGMSTAHVQAMYVSVRSYQCPPIPSGSTKASFGAVVKSTFFMCPSSASTGVGACGPDINTELPCVEHAIYTILTVSCE